MWYPKKALKKQEPDIYIIIPTIRTLSFLRDWERQFENCFLVIVEDHAKRQIETPQTPSRKIYHYDWSDIDGEFGKNGWIFSRQNAGIRSYGFWKAYEKGADVIITLDDDCYPAEPDFVQKHMDNLSASAPVRWMTTFPHPEYMYTRGFPYEIRSKRPVMVSHGLWSNKMDMDARTQKHIGDVNIPAYPLLRQYVPKGEYFPMSSMNLAFLRDAAPLMYFPLMGRDPSGNNWGFDRFDDIWAGIFAKKILDHLEYAVVNGSPFVEHRKASDVETNLVKEKPGLKMNERVWHLVDRVFLTQSSPAACYKELSQQIEFPDTPYFRKLREAMGIWAELFL